MLIWLMCHVWAFFYAVYNPRSSVFPGGEEITWTWRPSMPSHLRIGCCAGRGWIHIVSYLHVAHHKAATHEVTQEWFGLYLSGTAADSPCNQTESRRKHEPEIGPIHAFFFPSANASRSLNVKKKKTQKGSK